MKSIKSLIPGYISPFETFGPSLKEKRLLEKWEKHYERLGIPTKQHLCRPKTVELLVDAIRDQEVWPRLLSDG